MLARGSIEFFTDATLITPKPIFSDSDLTIAQSNPYTLDNEGRILGDVHYAGTATLVVDDVDGVEVRQLDLVVSADDGGTNLTIYRESVAAMVADNALAVGEIVRTHGYFAPNHYGSGRYKIVAAATGTIDNFKFIALGNGLQAALLDGDRSNSFLVAGARGDGGTDDTDAMQALIDLGGDIIVDQGFVFVGTNLTISRNCRFIGGGSMKQRNGAAGDFLRIISKTVALVHFRDVELDGNQPNVNQDNSTFGWVIPAP